MSAGEIARITGLATASVTNLVDRLEQKGFVRRKHDPSDRRRILVEAVADRVTSARPLFASTTRSLARLFRCYSEEDLTVIADFLRRNAERLREETRKLESMSPAAGEARR
jgi:DNA-binding MarR family transcriptional regulator